MHRDFCNFRSHSRGSLYARDSSGSRDQRTPRCQQQPPNNQGLQPEGLKISKGQLPSEWAVRLGLRWLQSTSVGITSKNCATSEGLFGSAEKLAARPTNAGSITSLRRFSPDLRGILNWPSYSNEAFTQCGRFCATKPQKWASMMMRLQFIFRSTL